jgi:alpha-tubulin suppressor-like RCC1 family protein
MDNLAWGSIFKEVFIPMQVGLGSKLEKEKVVDAVWGNCHAIVLTENGKIYGWGQGIIEATKAEKLQISTEVPMGNFDFTKKLDENDLYKLPQEDDK